MKNDRELKKVTETVQIEESEKLAKYGVDFQEELDKTIKKRQKPIKQKMKKIARKITVISTGICIILIMSLSFLIASVHIGNVLGRKKVDLKEQVELASGGEVKLLVRDVDFYGNGLFIYKLKELPQIKIRAIRLYTSGEDDTLDRINKYFFERWQDIDKNKFTAKEEYKKTSINVNNGENKLINYFTYIEVNNYDELLKATEAIIRYTKFTGKWKTTSKNIIKYADKEIIPNNRINQTDDEIREEAKKQYMNIIKEKP